MNATDLDKLLHLLDMLIIEQTDLNTARSRRRADLLTEAYDTADAIREDR